MRIRVVVSLLLAAAILGCQSREASVRDDATAVGDLADRYVREYFEHFPDDGTGSGYGAADHGRIRDNSLDGVRAWQAREDAFLEELQAIDGSRLDGTPGYVPYAFVKELLEASIGYRICRIELWNVSPTWTGWQNAYAFLASLQPGGTVEAREQTLSRYSSLPRYLDAEIANLREGVRLGYTAPRNNVQSVIAQMDGLLAAPPRESPFFSPALRDTNEAFAAELEELVVNDIRPAIQRYRDFLANEYLPEARADIAVAANTDGPECYRAAVRYHTTISIDPEEIHRMGLEQMEKITAQMRTIGARSFGTTDASALLQRLKSEPEFTFRSRQEIIDYASAAVDRAKQQVPRWFGIVPEADVVIQPYAPFQEKSAPLGQYATPSEDGTRPGTYLINTYGPEKQSKAGVESVAFHETYPGHHLQGSIALEGRGGGTHPITRYFFLSGFGEGWALYAERLSDEMGLFSDDVARMGLLSNEAHRAARLVTDAGMHALGWSREQAIEYLLAHTALAPSNAAAEIDRYIAVPGQATAYMIGNLEIRRLRAMAEADQGADFDIRQFHDRVLEDGALPLPVLRSKIERWVRESD